MNSERDFLSQKLGVGDSNFPLSMILKNGLETSNITSPHADKGDITEHSVFFQTPENCCSTFSEITQFKAKFFRHG